MNRYPIAILLALCVLVVAVYLLLMRAFSCL
jgi:hypothetical protein